MFLYAWYCYELLVVSELQEFGAVELALKLGPEELRVMDMLIGMQNGHAGARQSIVHVASSAR